MTIDLPPNLYNDSSWMGLVLCAYFAIDVETTAHFNIPDLDTGPAQAFRRPKTKSSNGTYVII